MRSTSIRSMSRDDAGRFDDAAQHEYCVYPVERPADGTEPYEWVVVDLAVPPSRNRQTGQVSRHVVAGPFDLNTAIATSARMNREVGL